MQNSTISFNDLNLSASTLDALLKKGFTKPSPIQEKVIPLLLKTSSHVIGQAQTGTGKTAAFGIPLVERLDDNVPYTQAIVLTPTRELCLQVCEEINSLKSTKRLNIIPIYGGQSISLQMTKLKKSPHIIVGTPGRVIDHLDRGSIKIDKIKFFVLDEADEMFSMGFQEDVETIMKFSAASNPQILLFSATFPKIVQKLVNKYIPIHEQVSVAPEEVTTALINQKYYAVPNSQKFQALTRIIDTAGDFYGIIFCQTKVTVQEVAQKLIEKGYKVADIHGDLSQNQREIALKKFKKHSINILVATDVAARGIDVQDLNYVVNYSLPQDPEAYVHRIGRTGRAGKEGIAISLVTQSEFPQLMLIKRVAKADIQKGQLPTPEDLIEKRTAMFVESLHILAHSEQSIKDLSHVEALTDELMELYPDNKKLIGLLLEHFAGDILLPRKYADIQEEDYSNGSSSQRVFIALGKMQNATNESIKQLLMDKSDLKDSAINDILVLDNFSFATIPVNEAHAIVKDEKRLATRDKKPLITLAKNKDGSGGGGGGFRRSNSSFQDRDRSGGGYGGNRGGGFRKSNDDRGGSYGGNRGGGSYGGGSDRGDRKYSSFKRGV